MKLKEKKLSHLDIKPCNILIKKLDLDDENNLLEKSHNNNLVENK